MKSQKSPLLFPACARPEDGVLNHLSSNKAGWGFLNFEARSLIHNETFSFDTDDCEAVLVMLGGVCSIETARNKWHRVGRRRNVFDGMPYAVYFPRHTQFKVECLSPHSEWGLGWVPAEEDHPERLITPEDAAVEIRGGGNATRQINSIIPPGFPCHRLVCVEVYTPGGNWSSYPPHKHDVHTLNEEGSLLEADLEEIYFYKFHHPNAFAIQRVYNDDFSLDETVTASENDIVIVPEGYHPVSAPWGYDCYYLNLLAGSAQSLAATDDPHHAWVKQTWTSKDSRVPLVHAGMEKGAA